MSSLAKHVIHQPKPFRTTIIVIISITISTIAMWLYQQQFATQLSQKLHVSQLNNQTLLSDKQQLQQSLQHRTEELATQHQILAIQQATDQQVQQQISQLQGTVVHLNKELMFYQNITQGTNTSKLQIRELHLRADETQTDTVHYRIVMTQGKKISKPITGTISVILNYPNERESTLFDEHPLSLRHVQILEGQIKLADNVKPNTVTVTLEQNKKTTLSQDFDWRVASDN
ncbi:MAG: DUF6776 family protein [Methylophagaceae bacterium]